MRLDETTVINNASGINAPICHSSRGKCLPVEIFVAVVLNGTLLSTATRVKLGDELRYRWSLLIRSCGTIVYRRMPYENTTGCGVLIYAKSVPRFSGLG